MVDEHFPAVLCLSFFCLRNRIILTVKSDQRPDRTVYALPYGLFEIRQGLKEVVAAYVCDILTDSCQRQYYTGIFRVFFFVENAFFAFYGVYNAGFVSAVHRGIYGLAASCKAKDLPFAPCGADGRGAGCCHFCQVFSGCFVCFLKAGC